MIKNRMNKPTAASAFMTALAISMIFPVSAQAGPPSNSDRLNAPVLNIAQLGMPITTPPVVAPKPNESMQLQTLRQAVKAGKATMKVKGDGVTTSSVRLQITNKTNAPLKIIVPSNEILKPNVSGVQNMMVIADVFMTIPVGQTTIAKIPTVCASVKTVPPPPADGVEFSAGNYEDPGVWKQLSGIIAASKEIERAGGYKGLPVAGSAKEQISQLAVWRLLGLKSGAPEHQVTPQTIQQDLINAVSEAVKKNPGMLGQLGGGYSIDSKTGNLIVAEAQRKKLDERCNAIFDAVDLTIRRSSDPNLKKVASLPSDSTWDTFVNVGERAFDDGNFIEAEEMLGQSLTEAEAFGEADPRLTRSMTSLGKTYLDLSWYEKAEPLFSRALALRTKVQGANSPEVAEVDNCLGMLKQQQALYGQAEEFFKKALAILDQAANSSSKALAEVLSNIGKNFYLQENGEAAIEPLKRAMAIMLLNAQQGVEKGQTVQLPPEVAEVETNLAWAYLQVGKLQEAATLLQKALAIDTKALGEDHPFVAKILEGLATASQKQGQNESAELFKKQAQAIREKSLGQDHEIIAALPLGTDSLTRIKLHVEGAKNIAENMESVKASARTISGDSMDKERVNRPIKDKWALVIGISKFADSSINLKYAAKDAQDFKEYLVKEAKFAPDHVRLLIDEQATRENILANLGDKWLPRVANPDDLVLIYVSSHGSPSKVDLQGANYLVAHNTDKNSLYATGVNMQNLVKMIKDRVHSDRIVLMMDACHSGAANTAGKGIFRIGNYSADELAQGSGQLVICSSEPTQTSWESKRYQNGVFTHYLLEGLRQNGGMNKLGQAFKHMQEKVQEEVLRDRGELQRPLLKSKWVGDDLILGASPVAPRVGMEEDQPRVQNTNIQANTTASGASKATQTGKSAAGAGKTAPPVRVTPKAVPGGKSGAKK